MYELCTAKFYVRIIIAVVRSYYLCSNAGYAHLRFKRPALTVHVRQNIQEPKKENFQRYYYILH